MSMGVWGRIDQQYDVWLPELGIQEFDHRVLMHLEIKIFWKHGEGCYQRIRQSNFFYGRFLLWLIER